MLSKKVIVCDLDGTLAPSKSSLSKEMADVLGKILSQYKLAVVSGGAYSQFEKQFLTNLTVSPELLSNLSLFPTMGTTCYLFDPIESVWKQVYNEPLSPEERQKIIAALHEVMQRSGLDFSHTDGEVVEDRESQVTFSALGQNASIEKKKDWDPDQAKRKALREELLKTIPEFEIKIGGTTSIDITKKGLDKAYAIGKIKELLKVMDEDILFIGDALYHGGNDEAVKKTGVDYIQPRDPEDTIELLTSYL